MSKAIKADRTDDVKAAAGEYEAAYRQYEAATKMNVPTPEGAGTFGGVWDCDQSRLSRALVLAVRRTIGTCSIAAEKAARGETISVGECGYGEMPTGHDVYRTPNGMYRDHDGRYLTATESGFVRVAVSGADHYFAPGPMTQRFIDEAAGDQVARTLTKAYIVGWPVCTDQQKIDAYRRVAAIYRTLAECFAAV